MGIFPVLEVVGAGLVDDVNFEKDSWKVRFYTHKWKQAIQSVVPIYQLGPEIGLLSRDPHLFAS